jgi:hypothetical protein
MTEGIGAKKEITPLPLGQIMTVFMVQLCEGININVLFPFVAFMVEDFGYTGKELGYHVGGLAATFCLAQFVSSIPWGMLSDHIGRKPPVVLGVLCSGIGMIVLGFSTTYAQAIAGRAISGLLTGNVGILKSFLTEITDDTNRGHGFSLMSLGWSLGTIIGPLAGGILAYPALKYPGTFSPDGIFAKHAFLLPCLVCVGCNVLSGLFCMAFMEESRWNRTAGGRPKEGDRESSASCFNACFTSIGLFIARMSSSSFSGDDIDYSALDSSEHSLAGSLDEEHHDRDRDRDRDDSGESYDADTDTDYDFSSDLDLKFNSSESNILSSLSKEYDRSINGDIEMMNGAGAEGPPAKPTDGSSPLENGNGNGSKDGAVVLEISSGSGGDYDLQEGGESEAGGKKSFITRDVVLAISAYGLCAMGFIVIDETIPLMLKLSRADGGLSFNSSKIGALLALGGLTMLLWTLLLLPKISHLSKLWLLKTFNVVCIPVVLLYPALATCNELILTQLGEETGRKLVFVLYVLIMTAKNCLATIIFLSVILCYSSKLSFKHALCFSVTYPDLLNLNFFYLLLYPGYDICESQCGGPPAGRRERPGADGGRPRPRRGSRPGGVHVVSE